MPSEQEIQQLVLRSQNGDNDAFGDLYEHFVDSIYRYVYFKVDASDAEDLTETVFVKVWENIQQYKQQKCRFSSWVFRIAHNVVVDHYRMNHSIEALVEDYQDHRTEHNPLFRTEQKMSGETVQSALKELKDIYQQVLVLKFINNFSNAEIAQIMRKSDGSLRILQYRALRALRKVLEDRGIEY